ncbi:MAG: bifunctional lysylphosphatidylglycerol flippase/synthetase MprF [Enterococcus sp.]
MKAKGTLVLNWMKAHSLLLRLIFFGSILVFVSNQVINIAHGMSWQDVLVTMKHQSLGSLLLMTLLGLVGIVPMLGYDWVIITSLEQRGKPKMNRLSWFICGWITNTINNLAGFGGVIGTSLRNNFYGKDLSRKIVLGTVSKTALFLFSGLSFWSLALLMDVFFFREPTIFRNYWIWLVGASWYAPILFSFTYLRRKQLFADFYLKGVLQLFGISFAQWGGAFFVFWGIGRIMGIELSAIATYPMFFIATVIGMLTLVPGGMGTFDVLMILGLGQLGLSQSETVVWLLYYRLFYYLIPFLSGILLLLRQTGVKMNRFFNNLPQLAMQKSAHFLLVVAIYFAGVMMVLLSTVTNLSNLSTIFEFLLPFSFDFLDQTLNLLVGFLLLGLARATASKVKRAYLPTMLLLFFGITNTISRTRSFQLVVVYCLILLMVWLARKEYYRKKFVYSWGALLCDSLLFGVLLIAYGVAGYHRGQWWNNQVLGEKFLLFPSEATWFSGLIGVAVSLLTLLALQQYLSKSAVALGEDWQEARFQQLLERFGGTKSSHRLQLTGYRYFYYQEEGRDQVVFGYQTKGNRCFVLGDPIGNKIKWKQSTLAFIEQADQLGYQLAFYKISEKYAVLLHDLGFRFIKIGETGQVVLSQSLEVIDEQTSMQELIQAGYHFSYYERIPAELIVKLQVISSKWLNGQPEKKFASGRFELAYLRKSSVGVLWHEQRVVGFVTEQPINERWVSYDLLRLEPELPDEAANFMVRSLVKVWQEQGYYAVELGLVPLVNVGDGPSASTQERLMNLIYQFGNTFYDFQTHFAGKQQYVEKWHGAYFAYPKNGNFYLAAAQLFALIGRGKNKGVTLVEEVTSVTKE